MTRDTIGLRVDLLGPLRVTVGPDVVDVSGPRRRAVVALLALSAGRTVSDAVLLDAVWPDEMPDSGRRVLHSLVSRLRGHLGPAARRLVRDAVGYRLDLAGDELDVIEVRGLVERARSADPAVAAGLLERVLSAWRGDALDEFAEVAPLAAEAVALADLRLDVTDDWIEARLAARAEPVGAAAADDPAAIVADASRAATAVPIREPTHALLVRALAAAGRQTDALRAANDFRRRLVEETGLDPSPAFADLENEVALGWLAPPGDPAAAGGRQIGRPAAPMIGRDHEAGTLRRLVGDQRLVTVVGPGGVGKTRLATDVAADASEAGRPAVLVELATVQDPRRVVDALATALRMRAPSSSGLADGVRDALAAGAPLLVLDNCEHLIAAARDLVGHLLAGTTGLTVLATSREPLGLSGEQLLRLGPLPVPEVNAADARDVAGVAAFLVHARQRSDLEPSALDGEDMRRVSDVVRRLDGLPLALELAAGQLGTLSLGDLHDRLDRSLDLLAAGRTSSEARHRTLRDTIVWSYQALATDEQRLLQALAVFPGGVDLRTAERLGTRLGPSTDPARSVARLVETSMLLSAAVDGAGRYRALETVRSFALDALDQPQALGRPTAVSGRAWADGELVSWAVDATAEMGQQADGPGEPQADARLRTELPNVRAAWDVADRRGDVDDRVAMTLHLDRMLTYRGLPDLRSWALELAEDARLESHGARAAVVGAAARAAWRQGDLEEAGRLGTACIDLATRPEDAYRGREALGAVALFRGDPAACDIWLTAGQEAGRGAHLVAPAALAAGYAGDEARARELLGRAFVEVAASGVPSDQAFVHYVAAEFAAATDAQDAVAHYGHAIELARGCGASFVDGVASVGLVRLWAASGRVAQALEGYRRLLVEWRDSGHWTQLWTTLRNLAGPLSDAGQPATAALVLHAADLAPEAPLVTVPAVAAELAALTTRLEDELGPDGVAAARLRAATLSRVDVVSDAVAAIDAARA